MAFGKLRQIYIVEGGYKREPEPVASPQSTTLHSTGNISVKKEVSHSNTRGTVRLCSIPAEVLLHIVHIFNILCGLEVLDSRRLQEREASLPLFISTANEHILIR